MNKTQMKKLFKECLHDQELFEANKALILDVANKYKVGFGFPESSEINVQKSKKWNNMQFCTEHGTFSYIKAVDFYHGKLESPESRLKAALRRHLHCYMMEFKRSCLPCLCVHTWIELNMDNSHVDHVGLFEFDDIANDFIKRDLNAPVDKLEYRKTDDGDLLLDESIFERFLELHNKLAELELVHSSHNLSRGKK